MTKFELPKEWLPKKSKIKQFIEETANDEHITIQQKIESIIGYAIVLDRHSYRLRKMVEICFIYWLSTINVRDEMIIEAL
jgi:hypothetical protein